MRGVVIGLGVLVLVAAGCGSKASAPTTTTAAAVAAPTKGCPPAWRAGWQRVANQIKAPVFCPSWMPAPLSGKFGSQWFNGRFVDPDRSYLVSFAWFEPSATGIEEVHVNFRGYPGHTAIPICEDTLTVNGKTVHPKIPCFADPHGSKRFGSRTVTVYTANQGVDQWHILYAWREAGSLYTISEHVVSPYSYAQVVGNLDRIMRGLDRLRPTA